MWKPAAIVSLVRDDILAQDLVDLGLVAITEGMGFEPRQHVAVEAYRDRLFRRAVKLSPFRFIPTENLGHIAKVYVVL